MPANINGAERAVPGTYSETESITQGVAVPSGSRRAVMIGEGQRNQVIVNSASGNGNDGIAFEGTVDGRHFQLSQYPIISNRTRLFRNGIQISVLEDEIDADVFDTRYDARVDIDTGEIELQGASLVDQGGAYYRTGSTNTGDATVSDIVLLDPNAPAETWTARVTSVRRDGYGTPIDGYAKLVVKGTVSGVLLDSDGNQITWQSDGQTRNNGVIQFAVTEGSQALVEGDSFIFGVQGGPLRTGESLTANYIGVLDVNDPVYFEDIRQLTAKHGQPSLANRLSLGAQIAWANGTPGMFALQAAPALPRRVSYSLVDSSNGEADIEELTFALPLGVVPDAETNINFFVENATTGVESQLIPNKVEFYDPDITSAPTSFIFGNYDFSYTVVLDDSVQKAGTDGELTVVSGTTATLSSDSVVFNIQDLEATRNVKIVNASNAANNGTFGILSITNGIVTIQNLSGFVTETGIEFQVLDSAFSSARILFTDDLALSLGQSLRASIVDTKDADFYDPGWISAYDAAERIDVDMVVPLPSQTMSVIFQNGKAHVATMSGIKNRRERTLIIGAVSGLTPDNVIGNTPAAVEDIGILEGIQGDSAAEILSGEIEDLSDYGVQNAFGDTFRASYMYPDQIIVQTGADRVVADGMFMAAALAGYYSGSALIQEPATNKTIGGFTIDRSRLFSPTVEENLVAAGITLVRPVAGGGLIIHAKTTTNSLLPEEEEQSVVFIRDRIAKDMRVAFNPFVGKAETDNLRSTLFARANKMCKSFISRRLITQFRDVTVERDPVSPTQWNVTFKCQPVFGTNWIKITIGIGVL